MTKLCFARDVIIETLHLEYQDYLKEKPNLDLAKFYLHFYLTKCVIPFKKIHKVWIL